MNPESLTQTAVSGPVRMQARLTLTPDTCTVDYEIQATGSQMIYLFDALPGPGTAGPVHQPDLAWVGWRHPDSALLMRAAPPLPKAVDVLVAISPLARRVEPGKSLTGRIRLRLPLTESNPYFPAGAAARMVSTKVARILVEVEYLLATEGIKATEFPGSPGLYQISKVHATDPPLAFQRLKTAFGVDSPVLMERRTDDAFEPL